MDAKTYELKNGTVYSIVPLTQARILQTVRALRKKGKVVSMQDSEFESNIEFQFALGSTVCPSISLKQLDGSQKELGELEKRLHLEDTPGALNFVLGKASELAKEAASIYEADQGNS